MDQMLETNNIHFDVGMDDVLRKEDYFKESKNVQNPKTNDDIKKDDLEEKTF